VRNDTESEREKEKERGDMYDEEITMQDGRAISS
jgi:hypothetical protein